MQTVLIKEETEYQLIELCCSVLLFLVLWSNFHGMTTIRRGVLVREESNTNLTERGRKGAGVDRGYQTEEAFI